MGTSLSRRRFLVTAAAFPLAAIATRGRAQSAIEPLDLAWAPVAIEVKARPIASFDMRDRSHLRFGSLQWRSGLVLTSSFPRFGGLSGLRLDNKGERFVSFSDKGTWFTGRIVYQDNESSIRAMSGLADVEAAPMLGPDGRPITARGWYDSESIAIDGAQIENAHVYIGLERVNQVLRFDFGKGFTRSRGEVVAMPPAVKKLPTNKGLEALVFVPKGRPLAGTLIALSERGLDADGNLVAFLVGGPSPGSFSVRRSQKFDISDATLLASGDLLILERKFSLIEGLNVRIRRIPLKSLSPGALVDGPVIFEADLGDEVDNMEGIDSFVTPEGDTVLTMVSDDNFSMIQRTLMLQFTLVD